MRYLAVPLLWLIGCASAFLAFAALSWHDCNSAIDPYADDWWSVASTWGVHFASLAGSVLTLVLLIACFGLSRFTGTRFERWSAFAIPIAVVVPLLCAVPGLSHAAVPSACRP